MSHVDKNFVAGRRSSICFLFINGEQKRRERKERVAKDIYSQTLM